MERFRDLYSLCLSFAVSLLSRFHFLNLFPVGLCSTLKEGLSWVLSSGILNLLSWCPSIGLGCRTETVHRVCGCLFLIQFFVGMLFRLVISKLALI